MKTYLIDETYSGIFQNINANNPQEALIQWIKDNFNQFNSLDTSWCFDFEVTAKED